MASRGTSEEVKILKVGVDLVYIPRFSEIVRMSPRVLDRIFDPEELQENLNIQSRAGRFALKEAIRKCIEGEIFFDLRDIRIQNIGGALRASLKRTPSAPENLQTIVCSISHESKYAVAMAVMIQGALE